MIDAQKFFGQIPDEENTSKQADQEIGDSSDTEFEDINKYLQSDNEEQEEVKPRKKSSKAKPDLVKVFELKPQEEVKYEECHKKLHLDDISMMK